MEMLLFAFAIIILCHVVAQPTNSLKIVGLDGGQGPFLIDETFNISWAGEQGSALPEYSDLWITTRVGFDQRIKGMPPPTSHKQDTDVFA
jgi:hypothetical protein